MIQSVQRATAILRLLSDNSDRSLAAGEIARALELNAATCSHILETLCNDLYVERVSRKEGYRLGPRSYMLTRRDRYQESLIRNSSPIIERLDSELGCTVFVDVVCNGYKFVINYRDRLKLLRNTEDSIIEGGLIGTSSGMLHMAYMSKDTLRYSVSRHLSMSSPEEIAGFIAGLQNEFMKIRKAGFCCRPVPSLEEMSFAFPIYNGRKYVAALGVVYPDSMDSKEFRRKVVESCLNGAAEISRRISF